jgi:hypothetical protein
VKQNSSIFSINTGFNFILWYENDLIPLEENESCIYRKNLNILFTCISSWYTLQYTHKWPLWQYFFFFIFLNCSKLIFGKNCRYIKFTIVRNNVLNIHYLSLLSQNGLFTSLFVVYGGVFLHYNIQRLFRPLKWQHGNKTRKQDHITTKSNCQ